MTYMGLFFSRYINGVSMHHGEISQYMFPNYPVNSISNGVHAVTWASDPFRELFDRHIPEWRRDNLYLRYAINIPIQEIQTAHAEAKRQLLGEVQRRTGRRLDPGRFTVGFARRATAYKRLDLIFSDLPRLREIAQGGQLQIIWGGKAHPQDEGGKTMIGKIFLAAAELGDALPVVYLDDYGMTAARYLCSGVDLWLNTPQRPLEASGTSGMKAAINGVPSLSVLDGWWIEGALEGVTGWSIEDAPDGDSAAEVTSMYNKLEDILVLYYERSADYARVMRSTIALNSAYYNAQRMLYQYQVNSYNERP